MAGEFGSTLHRPFDLGDPNEHAEHPDEHVDGADVTRTAASSPRVEA